MSDSGGGLGATARVEVRSDAASMTASRPVSLVNVTHQALRATVRSVVILDVVSSNQLVNLMTRPNRYWAADMQRLALECHSRYSDGPLSGALWPVLASNGLPEVRSGRPQQKPRKCGSRRQGVCKVPSRIAG